MKLGTQKLYYRSRPQAAGTINIITVDLVEDPTWIEDHSHKHLGIIRRSAKIGMVRFILEAAGASNAVRSADLMGYETISLDGTLERKEEYFETMSSRYGGIIEIIK